MFLFEGCVYQLTSELYEMLKKNFLTYGNFGFSVIFVISYAINVKKGIAFSTVQLYNKKT